MPTFNYKAKDKTGATVTGSVDASNESHAAALIREMGRMPMDIRSTRAARPSERRQTCRIAASRVISYIHFGQGSISGTSRSSSGNCPRSWEPECHFRRRSRSMRNRTGGRLGRIIAEMLDCVQRGETIVGCYG